MHQTKFYRCLVAGVCLWCITSKQGVAAVGQPVPTPPTVTTSQQTNNINGAACAQQLTDFINNNATAGLVAQGLGLGVAIGGIVAQGVGVAAAASTAGTSAEAIGLAADVAGLGTTAGGLGTQAAGLVTSGIGLGAQVAASKLPNCEAEFTGTVTVDAGGTNVTGDSIFNNNLGVANDLTVGRNAIIGGTQPGIAFGGGGIYGSGDGVTPIASDVNAIAIGNGSQALTATATAVGTNSLASNTNTSAYGSNSQATGANASAIGAFSTASGTNASAVGANSTANNTSTSAFGQASTASGVMSSAIGANAASVGNLSTVVGAGSTGTGLNSTVIGQGSQAISTNSSVYGQGSTATGVNATVSGQGSTANGLNATTNGQGSVALGTNTSAFGQGSMATALDATASGQASMAVGAQSAAFGVRTTAIGQGTSAFGTDAVAASAASSALGYASQANGYGSVALGSYSIANSPNGGWNGFLINGVAQTNTANATAVVSVGGGPGSAIPYRQITNVADGAVNPGSTDAINGSQLYKAITGLTNQINQLKAESRAGIAGAFALTAAPMPSAPGKTTWAGNVGFFQGAKAVGFSAAHSLDLDIPVKLTLTGGVAYSFTGYVGGRVGAMGEF